VPVDRMIEYVGRRPGEKLSETLTHASERACSLDHPSILGIAPGRSLPTRPVLSCLFRSVGDVLQRDLPHTDARRVVLNATPFPGGDGRAEPAPEPSPTESEPKKSA
jgi:hypothetical protein